MPYFVAAGDQRMVHLIVLPASGGDIPAISLTAYARGQDRIKAQAIAQEIEHPDADGGQSRTVSYDCSLPGLHPVVSVVRMASGSAVEHRSRIGTALDEPFRCSLSIPTERPLKPEERGNTAMEAAVATMTTGSLPPSCDVSFFSCSVGDFLPPAACPPT